MFGNRNDLNMGSGHDTVSGMKCLYTLIVANIVMLIVASSAQSQQVLELSKNTLLAGYLWQPLSAVFMHQGFMHLLFNMFSLYIFGSLSAPILGGKRFLFLFLAAGVFGNLVWLASVWNGYPLMRVCGASGAVMGVIMATAMLLPNVEMLLLFIPFPIKLRTMALVFVAIDIVGELNSLSNTAYMAHIGGFIAGYLIMVIFFRKYVCWDPLRALFGKKQANPGRGAEMPNGWKFTPPPANPSSGDYRMADSVPPFSGAPTGRVTQKELDYLLDKLSRTGINSLTEAEMERLRQAREQMRGNQS